MSSLLKRKTGVELSLNTMVILILVLLVLLIVIYLVLTGVINLNNVTSCEKNNAQCLDKCVDGTNHITGFPCGKDKVCCTPDT